MAMFTLGSLVLWPVIGSVLFFLYKDRARGAAVSILAGYLFLPASVGIDLPGLPEFGKEELVGALVFAILLTRRKVDTPLLIGGGFFTFMIFVAALTPVLTVVTNMDQVANGGRDLPAMAAYDIVSMLGDEVLRFLPLFIGFWLFGSIENQRTLLLCVVIFALCYTPLLLFEVRMSPQLHRMVYGFHPSDFAQTKRGDAFRPQVFMQHGLITAMFMFYAIIAAAGLWRAAGSKHGLEGHAHPLIAKWISAITAGFWVVLALSRSLGAFLFSILGLAIVLIAKPRVQLLAAAIISVAATSYPMLRAANLVPTETLLSMAASIDETRAASLQTRFDNEEELLARAMNRITFGWGSWGRNRLYDDNGNSRSITDGYWIIVLGVRGAVGYFATFFLFTFPIVLLWARSMANPRTAVSPITSAMALILALNVLDLIPNATITPLTLLFAGAVLRHAYDFGKEPATEPVSSLRAPPRRRTVL